MLSGKASARAVRAHFIVDAALNAMMLTDVLNAPLPIETDKSNRNDNAEVVTMQSDMSEEVIGTPDLDEARVVYEKLVEGTVTVEELWQSALETGHYICKPSRTCFPTWQPRATTCTLNLLECICNRWPI